MTNKTEKFISKSIKKFKDKFQYTAVDYVSPKLKIKLICPKHGIFEITPANHLSSTAGGCVQCQRDNAKVGTDRFIERSTKIHNGKYDYSLVDYKTTTTYVKIVCKEHGIFEQYPTAHANRGDGCPECGKHYKPKRYTQEEYIEKAREVHGDVYDLSSVIYIGCADKLYPTCREHGLFPQTGSRFLRGFGCPKCANRGFKYDEPCELYIHKVFTENIFIGLKFGVSYNHEARLKVLKQFSPNLEFETVFVKNFGTGREAFNIENAIKSKFSEVIPFIPKSTMGDGYTETLPPYSLQKLLEFINQTS